MSAEIAEECGTCGEVDDVEGECPGSLRSCGHHCNHIWEQDECCWCPIVVNEDGDLAWRDEPCSCWRYPVDMSDPDRYHPSNVDTELNPLCAVHGNASPWPRPAKPGDQS